jgi:hypothetical protein
MANVVYNTAKAKLMDGSIDLDTDTIRCALVTSAYSVDIDTHSAWSQISANEIAPSAGYTAEGFAITAKSVAVDTTNDRAYFDGSDAAWTSIGSAYAKAAVLVKDSGTAATSWLIAYIDTATGATFPVTLSGGDYTIQWAPTSSGGILYLS